MVRGKKKGKIPNASQPPQGDNKRGNMKIHRKSKREKERKREKKREEERQKVQTEGK